MLRSLRVRGFKSLADVEVAFAPLTVLFGPNAVGKSNLLEAILLLSRLGTERTLANAFEAPLRGYPAEAFTVPAAGLPGLLGQDSAELTLDAVIHPAGAAKENIRYRISVQLTPESGTLETIDEFLGRQRPDGSLKQKPRVEVSGNHLLIRRLGEAGQPRQEPLGLNHTQLSNLQFSGRNRYPDFDRLRLELAGWRMYYLDPRESMRAPQPPKETNDIGPRGELLAPFLYRLKVNPDFAANYAAISRVLHAAVPTIEGLDVDLDPQRGTLDIVIRQDGTPYSSRVVSEGTLRVLALCAIAGNPWPSTLVAFEEPENGVHPRRIEVIADLLLSMVRSRERQVLVTTHSPTLVAAFARRQRETKELVALYLCSQGGRATSFGAFDSSGPLFDDQEIRDSLLGHEDEALVQSALLRGWL